MQAAQGGQGVNNLASQFGLTPDQAQSAVQAVIPAFSQALQRMGQDPNALGGVLAHIASGAHQGSFADPSQAAASAQAGGNVLGQIFGSPQVSANISQQASRVSGVSPEIIQAMLPVVASMLMGGLMHSMNSQGLGGVLGQLANAVTASGGLGSVLEGGAGQAGQSGGGLGGLVGSVLGGLLGGGQSSASPQSSTLQTGLNSLINMFESGVQANPAHEQGISNILDSLGAQFAQGGARS
ncbi:MAG TPA: DUF937 domain-containing protein, partial [Roseiarcus sp.]|nr:DUF937 domain-containing protein [Roseiarcus sp.]